MTSSAPVRVEANDAPPDGPDGAGDSAVDWALAVKVARRVAGRERLGTSYLAASLDDDFATATATAEALVREHTGLSPPGSARSRVIDRDQWISTNVASMRRLLQPLTTRMADRLARSSFAPIGRSVAGTELGVLLGWFAQRVLGQYDVLVPTDDPVDGRVAERAPEGDAVYYVGPNVLALEKQLAFRPRDFRLWIALHEVTHRAQFLGVPWMHEYFHDLVARAMTMVDPDPRRLTRALLRMAEQVRRGRSPLDERGLAFLFATPTQRDALGRVQALMSLLEGHGNRVMNELGRVHVAGQARMARVLGHRRRSSGLVGIAHRLLGLEAKMRQYEVGERFVAGVEAEAGAAGIAMAWRAPECLPTVPELAAPARWLERVERLRPAMSS